MLQLVIATTLFFVLFFGIGFILNMLLKTTWFPVYAYIALIVGLVIYWSYGSEVSFAEDLAGYRIPDYLTAFGGLAGTVIGSSTISKLRNLGYKMF